MSTKKKKKRKKKQHRFFWFVIKLQIVLMLVVLAGFGYYYFGGYADQIQQMRREASKRLPQAQYREKQGLDFPHLRSYWEFAPVSQVTDQNSVSGYEPDILEAKHLLLTESFLYLYLNFCAIFKRTITDCFNCFREFYSLKC